MSAPLSAETKALIDRPNFAHRYFILQLAESHLTPKLFRQILARIERFAWHPTWGRCIGLTPGAGSSGGSGVSEEGSR